MVSHVNSSSYVTFQIREKRTLGSQGTIKTTDKTLDYVIDTILGACESLRRLNGRPKENSC